MEYVWIVVAFLAGFAGTYMWFSQKLKAEKLQWNAEQEALLKELREEIIDTEKEKGIAEAKEVELRLEMNTLNQKLEHEIEEKGKAMIEVAKLQTRIKGYEEQVSEIEALRKKIEEERNSRIEFEKKTAALESDLENAQKMLLEEKKRLEEVKEQMKQEFAIIANKVLKENSEEFSQHSKKNIGDLISPLKERIERFEKRVEDTYEKGRKDQLELHDEFKKIYHCCIITCNSSCIHHSKLRYRCKLQKDKKTHGEET
jgi:gas vesicle protein